MDNRNYPTPWDGWTFWENFLIDPQGNRYSPEMVRASLFAAQLAHELTGSPLQILSLRNELKKRLNTPAPEITIKWNGQETTIKPPFWMANFSA
ncbi:MAG: DUF3653 domain-containing protein [Thiothrix sp.]|uniref:DUF3653 domain-containing protein n=1 Tax=Thiothrix sp. TaxID=1032 RepID=UPI002608C8FA|nr:DUF3653 domain-containing protein [Thiothrix sp.]MDD5392824.1 DUF3653 domain-containing protein [Thiothrix sp.]